MKRYFLSISLAMCALVLWGQAPPRWMDRTERGRLYPSGAFLTGFVSETVRTGDDIPQTMERLKAEAQKALSESIRVRIEGHTLTSDRSLRVDGKEQIISTYQASVHASSNIELVGVKTDAWFDRRKNEVYAFACVNKRELADYCKAGIGLLLTQIESALLTAGQLEQSGEKARARKQCREAMSMLEQVRDAQDLLMVTDAADSESLQQTPSEALRNTAIHMLARLAQAVYVYVESREEIFGEKVDIIANKLKAVLSNSGCSFVTDAVQADFMLTLDASAREASNSDGLVYCYADVKIALFAVHKQKGVYEDKISQRSGSVDRERAGRKALENIAVTSITDKLMPWIKN
jgi:hypothetical protein